MKLTFNLDIGPFDDDYLGSKALEGRLETISNLLKEYDLKGTVSPDGLQVDLIPPSGKGRAVAAFWGSVEAFGRDLKAMEDFWDSQEAEEELERVEREAALWSYEP